MKRTSPVAIVLAGLGVAAVLVGLGWQAPRIFGGRGAANLVAAAPGDPSASPEVPGEGAAVPEPSASATKGVEKDKVAQGVPLNGTWAGNLKPGTLAISAKGGKAIAYLCDGDSIEWWLQGTAKDGKLDLKSKDGARLTGSADDKTAKGKIKAGTQTYDFTIAAVKKPSGLYRAAADVRGAKIVGGWIVLENGDQVGLATVDGRVVKPSKLDLADGTAVVNGTEVTAQPAEDVP